jgi:putative sugar O-methyltransferase
MNDRATSAFWRELGDEHARQLALDGLASVKRAQALRYFTWSWRWKDLGRSVQMRYLLRRISPVTVLRLLLTRSDLKASSWRGLDWPRRDRWLYTFAVRLLWTYARSHDVTQTLLLEEPPLGNPPPVKLHGRLISQDLANCALENAVMLSETKQPPGVVLEIGSGYGRTAYTLLSLFPDLSYTVIDVHPALDISRWYLGELFPKDRVSYVHASEVASIAADSVDLAVSISSLHNLTSDEVRDYLSLLDRVVRPGGQVYMKERRDWYNPAEQKRSLFSEYPVPPGWRLLLRRCAPVQTDFDEALWEVTTASPVG